MLVDKFHVFLCLFSHHFFPVQTLLELLIFLQDHGSNNQLFVTLRKQITIIQKTDKKIHDMTSAINEIDMEFEEIKNVNIETIGSLSQIHFRQYFSHIILFY
jgi:hypothetical protein